MSENIDNKILKKRGRKPKNRLQNSTIIEEPIDSEKEVIIAYLPININEIDEYNIASIYPNPTSGILNIESSEYLKKIEVFNMLGSLVGVYGNEKQIDLSKLNIGLYVIRFTSENSIEQRRVEVGR